MSFLPLICIVFLMAVALFFINDSRRAHAEAEKNWMDAMSTYSDLFDAVIELSKYERPRDSRGRFIRGDL